MRQQRDKKTEEWRKKGMKEQRDFDFNNVKVIDRCPLWSRRLFLEAWHSIREPNSINDHAHIPDIYKMLN